MVSEELALSPLGNQHPHNLVFVGDLSKILEAKIEIVNLEFTAKKDDRRGLTYLYPKEIVLNLGVDLKEEAPHIIQSMLSEVWERANPMSAKFRSLSMESLNLLRERVHEAVKKYQKESRMWVLRLVLMEGPTKSKTVIDAWRKLIEESGEPLIPLFRRAYRTEVGSPLRIEANEVKILSDMLIDLLRKIKIRVVQRRTKIEASSELDSPNYSDSLFGLTLREVFIGENNKDESELFRLLDGANLYSYRESAEFHLGSFLMASQEDAISALETFLRRGKIEAVQVVRYRAVGKEDVPGFESVIPVTLDLKEYPVQVKTLPGLYLSVIRGFSLGFRGINQDFFGCKSITMNLSCPYIVVLVPREIEESPFSLVLKGYVSSEEALRSQAERRERSDLLATGVWYHMAKGQGFHQPRDYSRLLYSILIDFLTWHRHKQAETSKMRAFLQLSSQPALCINGKTFFFEDLVGGGYEARTTWDYLLMTMKEGDLVDFFQENREYFEKKLVKSDVVALETIEKVVHSEQHLILEQAKRLSRLLSLLTQKVLPSLSHRLIANVPTISWGSGVADRHSGKTLGMIKTEAPFPLELRVGYEGSHETFAAGPTKLGGYVELVFEIR